MLTCEQKLEDARLAIMVAAAQPNNDNAATLAFFCHLLSRLPVQPNGPKGQKLFGLGTDGQRIYYSPEYVEDASLKELVGQYAHCALHISYLHNLRRGARDFQIWNISCDLSLNADLLEAGVYVPDQAYWPGKKGTPAAKLKPGLSAEEYYDLIKDNVKFEQPPVGGECFNGDESCVAEQQMAVGAAAMHGRSIGKLKGDIDRNIDGAREPTVDWKDVLRKFVLKNNKNEYSWQQPNRRHIHAGLYLPSLISQEIGHILIAVDCSGSIGQDELNQFAAEMHDILSCGTSRLTIYYHNVDVEKVQEWEATDGPLEISPCPSGGTSHLDVFRKLDQMEESPVCMICLTDMMSEFPKQGPDVPVLWAAIGQERVKPPFGELVRVKI